MKGNVGANVNSPVEIGMNKCRKNIRLPHYNYQSNGYYFVTIGIHNRLPLLKDHKSEIESCIQGLPDFIKGLTIDYFVVLDNHIHVIFIFENCARSLGRVVSAMKSAISKIVDAKVNSPKRADLHQPLQGIWQRNYYEHVIRNENALNKIREYIQNNPEAEKIDFKQFYNVMANVNSTKGRLVYPYKDALYLNITSRCPTACKFCIKFSWDFQYRGHNLLLKKEPSVKEVLALVGDPSRYSEIVFCGYGESTYRLKEMEKISVALKKNGAKKIRLNTIGLGNLIHRRDIVPDLARFLDAISISLNTVDPEEWVKVHRPRPEFKKRGFGSVVEFIRKCVKAIPETYVTVLDMPGVDLKKIKKFVKQLGAKLRVRPYLSKYESR